MESLENNHLTGRCPASPAREGGVKGHNMKMIIHFREAPPVRTGSFTLESSNPFNG